MLCLSGCVGIMISLASRSPRPARPVVSASRVRALIEAALPPQAHGVAYVDVSIPQLTRKPADLEDTHAPEVARLLASNWLLLEGLRRIERSHVAAVFAARMHSERTSEPFKLLLASVAASAGSRAGALYLLEALESTRYATRYNTLSAIAHLLEASDPHPPAWAVELALLALSDERRATGLNAPAPGASPDSWRGSWTSGTQIALASMAEDGPSFLSWKLADLKAAAALPWLVENAAKRGCDSFTFTALAHFADPGSVPIFLGCLRSSLRSERTSHASSMAPGEAGAAADALGKLKVRAAVPTLLEHLEFEEMIEALEAIGDPRALPALSALVAAHGRVFKAGREVCSACAGDREAAARVAIVRLTSSDPVASYCALLADMSLGEFHRRDVAERMHRLRAPGLIPCLAKAAQQDPSGLVVNPVIEILADFPYRAAVEALLAAFDADFEGKQDWHRAYEPEMFHQNIASSLRKLTGQSWGTNPERWRTWWSNEGRAAFVDGQVRRQEGDGRRW